MSIEGNLSAQDDEEMAAIEENAANCRGGIGRLGGRDY